MDIPEKVKVISFHCMRDSDSLDEKFDVWIHTSDDWSKTFKFENKPTEALDFLMHVLLKNFLTVNKIKG